MALGVLGGSPLGAVTVDELALDARYRVRRVRVEHGGAVSAGMIRDAMVLRLPPWYRVWARLTARVEFSATVLEADLQRVRRVLEEAGHYEATVEYDLEVDDDDVVIVLRVDEGPAVTVGEVVLTAMDFALPPDAEAALRAQLALAPGRIFTQAGYDESRAVLRRYFEEQGFAYVAVDKSATVDTAAREARVQYTIRRGRPAVLGSIRVTGLEDVGDDLILREQTWEAGDSYDPRKLAELQARVFGLRLFRVATVRPRNLADETGIVGVDVAVTEGPPRELRAGAGYGTDDGLRGELRWQHNNFFGGGRQLGVRLKASERLQEFGGEFRQPHFFDRRQTLLVPLLQGRQDEPGYTNAFVSLVPRIERTFTPSFRMALGYGAEYDDQTDVPNATIARLDGFRKSGWVFGPVLWLVHDTSDDLLRPGAGGLTRLMIEQAGGPWQGGYSFVRALVDLRRYVGVGFRTTVAARLRVGLADGFGQSDDLPMFRRFYAGGMDSTRGYRRHRVGPLNEFGSPVGGRSLYEASLELRRPIRGPLGAVVFADAGAVRRQPASFALNALQFGAGAGVRYDTAVGPLRVDLAFPVDPPSGEPSWRLHFSIGHMF